MPILYKNVRNVRFAKTSIRSIDSEFIPTVEVFRKILNCSLQPKLHLAEHNLDCVLKMFALEFSTNSPQYKLANIANFVLAMPLQMNQSVEVCNLEI